jgi:pimeloyl-ACP methyl ester carboxylesterase
MTQISEVRYARSSGDIDIAYEVIGDGPMDLVFVSGFISHLDLNWEFPWFNRLFVMDGFARVIAFDKRGTGLSDRSLGFGSFAERTDDIRAVMDAAGVERAALWGVSEGGPLSLLFAATYPERVSRLIVYGSAARFMRAPDYPIGPSPDQIDPVLDYMSRNWGTGRVYSMFIQHPADPVAAERGLARFERNACTPQMVVEIMRSNAQIDVREILPTISVPTLVVHNAGDPLVDVEHGRYLAEKIPGARYVEGTGDFHGSWRDEDMAWIGLQVAQSLGRPVDEPARLDRVLASVVFTDIVRSTERTAAAGDHGWRALLDRHDEIARREVDRFRGQLVNTTGDGLLATFDSPARGIECARAIQSGVRHLGIDIRAGVHTGEVELRGKDITGLGVVIARRICDLAGEGEVVTSRTVKDLVTASGITFADRGAHALKGVPDEWQLYAVAS